MFEFHLFIMCVCTHSDVEVRGQLAGLGSLLPLCGAWGSNSGGQASMAGIFSCWCHPGSYSIPYVDVAWCFVIIPRSAAVFVFLG